MTTRFSLGIRGKFVLVALFSLSCTVGVTLLYLPAHQARVVEAAARTKVLELGIMGARSVARAAREGDCEGAQAALDALEELPEIEGAQLFHSDGGLIAQSGENLHQRIRPSWLEQPRVEVIDRDPEMVLLIPVRIDDERVGTLVAFGTLRFARQVIMNERWMLFLIVSFSVLIGVVVALYFANYITSPIFELKRATSRVEEGDFDVELPVTSNDEIGQLTTAFNRMTEFLKRTTISRNALSKEVLERKRAYERIKSLKEKAEEAARVKSEFVANMSHEIRTPMNAIIGLTELALEEETNPDQREYLEMVNSAADSLLVIINDILDFSKIEAGKVELNTIEFDLNELLGKTLRTLSVRADQKGLELYCDASRDMPRMVQKDPVRLQQVLINLIGNAVKFTDAGSIELRVEVLERTRASVRLRFSVIDTGIGIAPARQKRIFEAFSQADGSTTRKFGGTGLGLSISAQLVEIMGGEISVESTLGEGSCFSFTVPFSIGSGEDAAGSADSPAWVHDGDDAPRQVWILDDHADVRELTARVFEHAGCRVRTFASGPAAQHALERSEHPDLIVVDYRMPGQDGLEFISQVRQSEARYRGELVLLKQASDLKVVSAGCSAFGVAATLNKPCLAVDLLETAANVFAKSREARPRDARPVASDDSSTTRVLLVEDNPVNQKLAQRMLERRGYSVTLAENGVRALEEWKKGGFDVVLMDVQMPEMGGLEATRRIRELERASDVATPIPIVAMTANVLDDDQQACFDAGMDGYVAKPVKAATLFEELERVIFHDHA